jgi:hypothetical protein
MMLGRQATGFIIHMVNHGWSVLFFSIFNFGCVQVNFRKKEANLLGTAPTRKDPNYRIC